MKKRLTWFQAWWNRLELADLADTVIDLDAANRTLLQRTELQRRRIALLQSEADVARVDIQKLRDENFDLSAIIQGFLLSTPTPDSDAGRIHPIELALGLLLTASFLAATYTIYWLAIITVIFAFPVLLWVIAVNRYDERAGQLDDRIMRARQALEERDAA